jgi:hypothetical protein
MGTTSTYLEVKTQLLSLLTTAFASSPGVSVTWSWAPTLSNRAVFLSRPFFVDDSDRDSSSIRFEQAVLRAGRQPRQETYTLPVSAVAVVENALAVQEADEAAWALAAVIDDLIAEKPNLDLTSIHWARLSDIDRVQYPRVTQEGAPVSWVVVLTLDIEITARLN